MGVLDYIIGYTLISILELNDSRTGLQLALGFLLLVIWKSVSEVSYYAQRDSHFIQLYNEQCVLEQLNGDSNLCQMYNDE